MHFYIVVEGPHWCNYIKKINDDDDDDDNNNNNNNNIHPSVYSNTESSNT